jgi:uncharacterized membrane protein SirB2
MSFADRFVLWLHIAFAVFTIGPITLAISSTPRYIRKRDTAILRYLARITMIFTVGALTVLIFGVALGQQLHDFSKPWLTAALTLFLVAIVLLVMIMRDQRAAIRAVEDALAASPRGGSDADVVAELEGGGSSPGGAQSAQGEGASASPAYAVAAHIASVERGRIVAMGGVVNLIWLAVLALMVWQP